MYINANIQNISINIFNIYVFSHSKSSNIDTIKKVNPQQLSRDLYHKYVTMNVNVKKREYSIIFDLG